MKEHEYKISMAAFAQKHFGFLSVNVRQRLIDEVWSTRLPLVEYWTEHIWKGMEGDIRLFKGFSVLDPIQLACMSDAEVVERLNLLRESEEYIQGSNPARIVKGVKGFTEDMQLQLILELREYRSVAKKVQPVLESLKRKESPAKLWEWWWCNRETKGIKHWAQFAFVAVLYQPSSAVIERFFSVYKGMTSTQQGSEKEDTSLVRALCRFNAGKMN